MAFLRPLLRPGAGLGRVAKGLDPVECGGEALTGVVVAGGLV